MFRLLEVAARILSEGYDVEVIEAHHRFKVDAPPARRCAWARSSPASLDATSRPALSTVAKGDTGERSAETIGFDDPWRRHGGDHTVLFAGIGERIEITHKRAAVCALCARLDAGGALSRPVVRSRIRHAGMLGLR